MLSENDKRAVARRFAAAAGHYDASARVQSRVADALADRLANLGVPAGGRVLELGCGTGLLTAAALARMPQVGRWLASDIAPDMVARCQTRAGHDSRLSLAVMDGEAPSVAPAFDLICSSLALQWFPDPARALARWRELLRPGGFLCVATLGSDTFAQWRACLTQAGAGRTAPLYPDASSLRAWLGPAGQVEQCNFVEHHTDAKHFLLSLRGIGADYAPVRLPTAVLRQAMRALDQQRPVAVTYDVRWLTWQAA